MAAILMAGGGCTSNPAIVSADDTAAPLTSEVHGVVTDELGAPVAGVHVSLCATVCFVDDSDTEGGFSFIAVEAIPHALLLQRLEDPTLAEPMVPLEIAPSSRRDVHIVMPTLSPAVPVLDPADAVTLPGGLMVTAASADLLDAGSPVSELAAADVPDPWRPPLDGIEREVVAVWYVSPYDAEADPPVSVAITDTWGLVSGRLFVADYTAATWVDGGSLTTVGGVLEGGAAPFLTTLVLTR